jgi:Phycobilisome degradation protein nblA
VNNQFNKITTKRSLATSRGAQMMDLPMQLSLEQKFNLKLYEEQVKGLDQSQSQEFLLEVLRQLMVKDNMIKHLLKQG